MLSFRYTREFKICNHIVSLMIRQSSMPPSKANKAHMIEERKIQVDDTYINFVRIGTGNHPVLLLPGSLGTIWTDFRPQIENLNVEKFTIVAWDPPGYGKSRPPNRTFPDDFLQRDAAWAHGLMKTLGYSKFSVVGWSAGGMTSLLLAAAYPKSILKAIVWGTNSYIHADEVKIYQNMKDIDKWSQKMKASMIQVYGEKYFQQTCLNLVDTFLKIYDKYDGELCKHVLSKIKCPTFIIHGTKDVMILPEQATYLKQNIANSRLYIFENGGHNLHLRYSKKFNKLVTNFLLEECTT